MPGVTLHFVLADRALRCWRDGSADPPFDIDDPVALNAFYHGSVGPDLGYFPGGHTVLSDLAHCVRTGVLTRALLQESVTASERAFAFGWLAHVLADQAIHPWIGRGVGEVLTGSQDRFVDGASDLHTHLRVEIGLDAFYARRHPELTRRRLELAFRGDQVDFLVRAYAATYGFLLPASLFERSHRATTRRVRQALASMRIVAALTPGDGFLGLPALRQVIRAAYRTETLRSLTLAYLNPVAPRPWLLDAIEAAVRAHTDCFLTHAAYDAAYLEDLNLDTGRPLSAERGYPGTSRALDGLAALTGRTPLLLEVPPDAEETARRAYG